MLAIGQTAYAAVETDYLETHITCTDCFGQRALTVIMGKAALAVAKVKAHSSEEAR